MSNPSQPRLLLVYAADSGPVNAVIHYIHKLIRPETYPCSLCAVTYGPLGERQQWREFLNQMSTPQIFLHRDEFEALHPGTGIPLPVVLLETGTSLESLVPAAEIDQCKDLESLITLLRGRLADNLPR